MATSFYVQVGSNRWKIWQGGHGKRMVLLFHGFGEYYEQYESFSKLIGEDFTLFVPELPFHGEE